MFTWGAGLGWWERAQRWPPLAVGIELVQRYNRHMVSMYAATLAYYTLLSTVPLLSFMLFIGSFFLNAQYVEKETLDGLRWLLPGEAETLRRNIASILEYRGALGAASVIGTLWSTSAIFTALERGVNAVWERGPRRAFWKPRVLGILSVLGLTAWVLFTFLARTLWQLLQHWLPLPEQWFYMIPASWLEHALSLGAITGLVVMVYKFFPTNPVRWRTAIGLGAAVGILWEITREFFAWALTVGLLNYPIVYGSLWGLVLPIVWAYWSYILFLSGAEVLAYVEEHGPLMQLQIAPSSSQGGQEC